MSTRTSLSLVLAAATWLALPLVIPASVARAQDAPRPAEGGGATDPERANALLERLESLHRRAAERPAPVDRSLLGNPETAAKERARAAREKEEWEAALAAIPDLALDYREAAGDAADLRAWYFSGFARVARADRVPRAESGELLVAGADDLRHYLENAPRDAVFRLDAQAHLAYASLRRAGGDVDALDAAVPDVGTAVRALLDAGRGPDAGRLAFLALKGLVAGGRESAAASLAAGWDAESADFGPSTKSVRFLVRRARVRPGAPMPELPELASYTGAPMPWKELAGSPYVLHFFSTTVSVTPREVETILVPLRDEWRAKGLRLVGCSLDHELSDADIERVRAYRDSISDTTPVEDGKKTSVRAWAESRGMDWPWYWDGKWTNNVLAQHLGIEVNAPFAILVDAEGTIRWRGLPYEGLAEAVEELLK